MPTEVPPQLPDIHLKVVPDPPEYVKVTAPLGQLGPLLLADVGATGNGFTVTVATGDHPETPQEADSQRA